MLMTIEKLVSILKAHGVVYYKLDDVIHAYIYANEKDYDTLTISDGKVLCNNEQIKLLEWLDY